MGTNSQNGNTPLSVAPELALHGERRLGQRNLGLMLTARGFSDGVYSTAYIECTSGCPTSTASNQTIEDNHVPGAIYFDANVNYKLANRTDVFLSVDNLLNKDPAQVAYGTSVGGAPLSVNGALYDLLGRTYRIGVRFRM